MKKIKFDMQEANIIQTMHNENTWNAIIIKGSGEISDRIEGYLRKMREKRRIRTNEYNGKIRRCKR